MNNCLKVFLAFAGAALSPAIYAQSVVSMWVHSGPGPERDVYVASIKAFNDSQKAIRVDLATLPEGSYHDLVQTVAKSNSMPCILDFDGPLVYNYAWSKKLISLNKFHELDAIKNDLLPSILRQGMYNDKLVSLGQYDSGLALWGNKKLLLKAGVRIPTTLDKTWGREEFESTLKKLKASGVPYPLDMKFNHKEGEWYAFGFAPIVQSFGGDIINRWDLKTATAAINSPESIQALTAVQGWIKAGYVNARSADDKDFIQGKSALAYVGHWTYQEYKKALGDDLILIPMPKFGSKVVTGAGSWNFGISSDCKDPQSAVKVLAYLMSPAEITRVTRVNGAIPGTLSAVKANKDFAPGGPLEIYIQQIMGGAATVRPETPAYPIISSAFSEAVLNISRGADVKTELDKAANKIDLNIKQNKGYIVR